VKKAISIIFVLSLFFCLTKTAMADTNLISLASTVHSYSNTGNGADQGVTNGPLTFDGNFSTSMGNTMGAQHNTSTVISQHTFAKPATINSFQYRITAGGHCGGNYDKSASYNIYVQYKAGGVWNYLPGSQFSGGVGDGSVNYDTGNVTYSTPINNVTDVVVYAYGQGHGEDRASNGSFAYIFEIQAWGTVDIGLRVYDGSGVIKIVCEPDGVLTSPLRIHKNGTTYAIVLVDPSDNRASRIRIKTNSGIKALAKN